MADLFDDWQLASALHVASVSTDYAEAARGRATDYLRRALGVEFTQATRTLTRRVPRLRQCQPLPGPLDSVTSVTVDGVTLAEGTDWEAADRGVSCPDGFGQYSTAAAAGDWCTLVVVYVAGFDAIPSDLASWGVVLAAAAYDGPRPGVKSTTIAVDGVSQSETYATGSGAEIGLPKSVLRQLRADYGSGRRLFGSVLTR